MADLETLAFGANPNADSKNESERTALNIYGYLMLKWWIDLSLIRVIFKSLELFEILINVELNLVNKT